jgi:hypothetical protein
MNAVLFGREKARETESGRVRRQWKSERARE